MPYPLAVAEGAGELPVPSFSNDSMIRRVHAQGVILLGGGRALLMQIAHPSVAQGVAEHSSFRSDRLGRLLRTLRPTLAIVFGSRDQAHGAARSIRHAHEQVVGTGYTASDPALLLWVWATLVDTALLMHGLFVRRLDPAEAEAYYGEMKEVGSMLGIPAASFPADLAAFRDYMARMDHELVVSPTARSLSGQIFRSTPTTGPIIWPLKLFTAALLPDRLRAGFGLGEATLTSTALRLIAPVMRFVLALVPQQLKGPPWFLMPRRAAEPYV
ncbi:MAG TPA: oxygenase MpaB family protein [Dehalococcoidia bacterium]